MKVTLIDYTGKGQPDPGRYAAALLLFTKSTRLRMAPEGLGEFLNMPYSNMRLELSKVAATIPSSWEFIHYSFIIEGVTRAFTHQLVRTRTASYAQQAMRIVDMGDFEYMTPEKVLEKEHLNNAYGHAMKSINASYQKLMKDGARAEDARGVLPTNILTNICMSCNLRTLVDLVIKRSSPRVQGEYRGVLEQMVEEVCTAHPWATIFLNRDNLAVIEELDILLDKLGVEESDKAEVWKRIDQIRRQDQ